MGEVDDRWRHVADARYLGPHSRNFPLFATTLEPELSPGDVFRRDWDNDRADPLGPIVVFNHGCDIDKCGIVLVARITSDSDTEPGLLGNIKSGRVWHAHYLNGCGEPGWVNLRTVHPVEGKLLLLRLDRRIHSMTDDGRLMLAGRFFSYMTRTLPPTATSSGTQPG